MNDNPKSKIRENIHVNDFFLGNNQVIIAAMWMYLKVVQKMLHNFFV